jgi:hypothetical protein
MFSFASLGGKIDCPDESKLGPPNFDISGQNYHQIESLVPKPGEPPKFAQLYIYDTQNEISNRMPHFWYVLFVKLSLYLKILMCFYLMIYLICGCIYILCCVIIIQIVY